MSLRHKLMLGFGGLLLILLTVSALSAVVLTRYSHRLERAFRENYDSAIFCDRMKEAIDALNVSAERLAWGRRLDATAASPQAAMADFEKNLRMQIANVSVQGERQLTDRLRERWEAYQLEYQRFRAAETESARRDIFRDGLLPVYQDVKKTAQETADLNMSYMVSVDGWLKRTLRSVRDTLLIFAAAGTFLAISLVAAVGATILTPLRVLIDSARQIESGNLEMSVKVRSRDEIGQLVEAFNAMAARLREFRRIDHERLHRTQETTQLAIDSLPDAVMVIGPGGIIEIVNRTARSHFGVEAGKSVQSLGLSWLSEIHERVCSTRQPWDPQTYRSAIQLFEAGREKFLLPHGVPMLNAAGELSGITIILVDVTRLRHADELKSGLLSTVSHELRTPLTSIRMTMHMLAQRRLGPMSPAQAEVINAAREDSDRLHQTIDNLLSISRIESGGQRFEFVEMAPEQIIAMAIEPLAAQFESKGLRLEVEAAPALPKVMADPNCVGYALSNLLSNALKYSPSGGLVRVDAQREEEWVCFSVSDSGPGVPPEYRARIFERFFRMPRAEGPAGAGLGLTIAREIVEAHGGAIEQRDRPGGGSTFRFTLRLASTAASSLDAHRRLVGDTPRS